VEKVLAGPALEGFYERESGVKRSLKEIVKLAIENKDDVAIKTIKRLTDFFGQGISVIVNIIDPDVIVVGGGVGNIDLLYSDGLASLRKNIFNNRVDTPIVKPMLGDSAGVFGAAFLVDK
jgi:predicted NBD/HSP70 family sugar kinase